jgi:hypothetical protein
MIAKMEGIIAIVPPAVKPRLLEPFQHHDAINMLIVVKRVQQAQPLFAEVIPDMALILIGMQTGLHVKAAPRLAVFK